jgi:hypothetical protein
VASSEFVGISPSSRMPTSSSSSDQLGQAVKTLVDIKRWAGTHNTTFRRPLGRSMATGKLAAPPQIPNFNHSMIASVTSVPSPGSHATNSPGQSYLISSGHRSYQSSLTSPLSSSPLGPTPQNALSPTPHHFRPNNIVLERMGLPVSPLQPRLPGSNYLGGRQSPPGTREVAGLQEFENCALFLTKIPPEATLHELFSVITTGAVFCLHINPPNGIHTTKAAKLAFMTPEAAEAFLKQTQSERGIVLHGKRIQGRYNRNGYVRNENIWQSRVLELIGPTSLMTLEYWTAHFSKFSEFELDAYRLLPTTVDGLSIMEFRFARIDGQAQTCLQCIKTDPSLQGIIQVRYGTDPCGSPAPP